MSSNATYSQLINRLSFDYAALNDEELISESKALPPKLLRWLAAHHPDNRCRKMFLRITNVLIGEGTVINCGFIVSDDYKPLLTIGKRVSISPNVVVICVSSPNNSELLNDPGFKERHVKSLPVLIDDDTWIGAGAIIFPGVRIGRRCIVGAGAVVIRDVPDEAIVAGSPANRIGVSIV